ncbi:MAG: hypothetical protein ACE5IY_14460 [bacterium]
MQITRIYCDSKGESRFQDIDIPLRDAGEIGRLSTNLPVNGIVFRENDADYNYDWHTAPQKQYIIMLDGEIEIEVSHGEIRTFRGGDILLVEDTHGKGHRTRITNNRPRRSVFVTLE